MHDALWAIVKELREFVRLFRELIQLLRHKFKSNVIGGTIHRIGDIDMPDTFPPLTPGTKATFQVAPAFSGAAFALDLARVAVASSDPANFPVVIDPTDTTGTIIVADIPATAAPLNDSEDITVDWSYTNPDGVVAHVTGTVTEVGIVDDVTGGTFARLT